MVDIDELENGGEEETEKTRTKDTTEPDTGSSVDASSEPYRQSIDGSPTPSGASVSDVSKEWKEEHSELNYKPHKGESEKDYVKRQVKECSEFYDNYLEIAKDNLDAVEKFALYHHTMGLALAEMVVGIKEVLRSRFNYSETEAHSKAMKITKKSGQNEAMEELISAIAKAMEEE